MCVCVCGGGGVGGGGVGGGGVSSEGAEEGSGTRGKSFLLKDTPNFEKGGKSNCFQEARVVTMTIY